MAVNKKIQSYGPANAKVMLIGEAPGADEVKEGRPFVGYAGKIVREQLSKAGIDPDRVYWANLCLERPPKNEIRSFFDDKGMPNATVMEGLAVLKQDIERINPNLIIPLGNYPLKFLTGKGHWAKASGDRPSGYTGIGVYRGSVLEGTPFAGGRKCIPTYHPAAAARNYPLRHIIRTDFTRAAGQLDFPEIRRPLEATIIEPTGADRNAWAEWLVSPAGTLSPEFRWNHGSDVALQTESTRLPSDPFLTGDIEYIGSKLLCLGATRHGDISIVFPTRTTGDIQFIRDILLSGVPLCFQNAMFDCSILEYFYDIACLKYLQHDTMIAMHAAYTEFPKDLGFIASIFTEQPVWFEETGAKFWAEVRKALGRNVSLQEYEDVYLPYNAIDVRVTHKAMVSMLADELTDEHVRSTYRHEMSLVDPLWKIGKRGVKMDLPKIEALKSTLESEIRTLEAGLQMLNNGEELNVKSSQQKAKFLYETLGIKFRGDKTPKGAWKMDDSNLANLQLKVTDSKQKAAIQMLRECAERRDRISKFCEIELDDDGRMRCHYDPAKTLTGRLASRKFYPTGKGTNLQNQDKDVTVRSCFVADPGMVFCYADLKSAESYVVAHITGDPMMLELHSDEYLSGKLDGHIFVASYLLDKAQEEITKDERYLGKRVRHGSNYMLSWFKLMNMINADAQKTGVSINAAQAKRLSERYLQLHPFLKNWWDDTLAKLWTTHTLYTLHGRKRVFYDSPDRCLPEAVAYVPQGTIGQHLNMGLLRLDDSYAAQGNWMTAWDANRFNPVAAKLYKGMSEEVNAARLQMILQIHDAIGFQIPEKHADTILPKVRELMSIPIRIERRGVEPYDITIPVDIQVGYNWGEADKTNPNGLVKWDEKAA